MKLNKFIGMGVAVLALSLALCGCGDRKSKSESNSETKSDTESASSSSQTSGKFSPMVTKDATSALGVNLDKRQAFKVVDAYLDQLCNLMQLDAKDTAKVKAMVSRCKKDLYAYVPWQLRDFFDETGLRDAELRWAVISLEDVNIRDYERPFNGLTMAIAGDINLEKLIPKSHVIRTIKLGQKCNKDGTDWKLMVYTNDIVFTEMSLEGEKAWCIKQRESKGGREPLGGNDQIGLHEESAILYALREFLHELEREGIVLHVTSLDGQLLLAASSRGALAKQIRLYRQGKGAGDLLGGFSAKKGELLRLKLEDDDIGEIMGRIVDKNIGDDSKSEYGNVPTKGIAEKRMPDVVDFMRRVSSVEAEMTVSSDGTLSTVASLKVASEEDADKIRALAKVGQMKVRSQWSEDPYMPREFVKMLDAVKIDGADGEIKVQNVNPLLAFYHEVSMKMFYADLSAVKRNGSKLLEAIKRVNDERAAKSLPPVWPRTRLRGGMAVPSDDVSARPYVSAADYFNALFDMEHYGTPEWEPVVDGELLSTLGKNAVVGNRIDAKGLDWSIAANVTEETWSSAPVLISANLNPVFVYESQHQLLGPKSGAAKSMFGDKAFVLLYKGGYGTWDRIEWGKWEAAKKYDPPRRGRSDRESPVEWLTPTGVVELERSKTEAKENKTEASQRWPQK